MGLVVIVLVVILFIWGYLAHASTENIRRATAHIPGPYNVPLLGCLLMAISINPKNVFEKNRVLKLQYGNIMKGWAFNRLYLATGNVELNKQIFSSPTQVTKLSLYCVLHQWLGTGLLLSNGTKWHTRRKIITPTLHFKILEQFLESFERQALILNDCLAEKADGKTAFDILPYIRSATLDIVAETMMGIKINAQTDKTVPYTAAIDEMTDLMAWRVIRPHLYNEVMFTLLYPFKKWRQMQLIRILHNFTKKVIEERRKGLTNKSAGNNFNGKIQDDIGTKKHMALLDVLMQTSSNGCPLSDEDIQEEVDTFMFGGHDTSSSGLSFTLHLLARHPQVQNKVLAEIRQIYGDDGPTSLTLMNLNELKYLECVIKESLRLYPPVPFIGREITEDFPYNHSQLGDGVLPAGTQVILDIYGISRDSQYYSNPTDFIPERHEAGYVGGAFSNLSFSAGPRNCIGQRFSIAEMKVILMKVLWAYELLPFGQDVELVMGILLRSDTGMQLGMRKRTMY